MLSYRPSEYRQHLRFSNERHLLVEGSSDKRLFGRLIEELYGKEHGIRIDSAEQLIESSAANPGNAGKVEEMCASVSDQPYAEKLVGFVDREYRDFELGDSLQDMVNKHKVLGRLVWSRGHSIENYYFDYATLEDPLRTFSVTEYFDEALSLFKEVFEATIRLACAVSLVETEARKSDLIKALDIIRDSILSDKSRSKRALDVTSELVVDYSIVKDNLTGKYNLTPEAAETVVTQLQGCVKTVGSTDFDVVRWLCRGHTGFRFVWKVYSCCVFRVCSRKQGVDPDAEASKALGSQEAHRFNICAEAWVRKALGNQNIYPLEVIHLLGLSKGKGNP